MEFFDKIYIDTICEEAGDKLGIGRYYKYEEEVQDEEDGEWYTETVSERIDGQESYLGYEP